MTQKLLITIYRDDVAPRFDLTSEVLIATVDADGEIIDRKTLVLPAPSSEDLCQLILSENIRTVICGGIEQEFYEYLRWKKVSVLDSVIGPFERAVDLARSGRLTSGLILFDRSPPQRGGG